MYYHASVYLPIGDEPPKISKVFGIRRSTALLCGYIGGYLAFLLIGACIFSLFEGPIETQLKSTLVQSKTQFLQDYPSVPCKLF